MQAVAADCLSDNPLTLAGRQRRVGFVFQARDALALIVIAHPALEGGIGAAARIAELSAQCRRVERHRAEAKGAHPPATGGRNTTVSPSLSDCDQSAKASLIATRNCSGLSFSPRSALSSAYSARASAASLVTVSSLRPACSRSSAKYWMFNLRFAPTRVRPAPFPAPALRSANSSRACRYSAAVLTLSSARASRNVSSS